MNVNVGNEVNVGCGFNSQSEVFRCPKCPRGYRWKGALYRHRRYECGVEAQFACELCPYRTKQKCNLMRHVAARHYNVITVEPAINNRTISS
ncbi:longitudinals lacking protein, isoforms A/B/D/L-like [Rhodnius prolixus]|uniref:longitudinals lacking protein, isoforms A/B/D/L-like n=1 Tax=Rhodnius prolixus TaxID=13249 RepID=UPI003D187F65